VAFYRAVQENSLDGEVSRKCTTVRVLSPLAHPHNNSLMQATRQIRSSYSARIVSAWRTTRGLTLEPSFLPSDPPDKTTLVSYAQFPEGITNNEASTRFSSFLFAKLIPKDQDPDQLCKSYQEKLSLPPLDTPEFRSALSNFVIPTFRAGWDRRYSHEVRSSILSSGKTVEGIHADEWDLSYKSFQDFCLHKPPPPEALSSIKRHRLIAIPDSGKLRLVTLGSKWQHLLSPLHRVIYSVLTSRSCVLRGTPLPSTFSAFPTSTDPHCSADYEASTDNLSSAHGLHILRLLRQTSTHVPGHIWDLAEASLTGQITWVAKDGTPHGFYQTTGQLMGNYLSFPLLCISNISTLFCALGSERAWSLVNRRLVVVNGDDLVFKAKSSEICRWREFLHFSGFVMNESKTSVHSRLFTLNSKLFRCGKVRVKKVWHLIPKGVFKKTDITKHTDMMSAHASVVRENAKGCPGKLWERTVRALTSVKKSAWKLTSVKRLCATSEREYKAWPKEWKKAERIKGHEVVFCPLKEKHDGERLYKVSWEFATLEERENSPYIAALARFNTHSREKVVSSNDRYIREWDVRMADNFLCQRYPVYGRVKEERVAWVSSFVACRQEPVFI
jgi:hypothetical protein